MEPLLEHDGVILREWRRGDFDRMEDIRQLDGFVMGEAEFVLLRNPPDFCRVVTVEHEGKPVCISSVFPLRRGVSEIMAVTSSGVERCKKGFCVVSDRYVKSIAEERLQCWVLEKHHVSRRWLERMGFELEGTARKFVNGENGCLYARVK